MADVLTFWKILSRSSIEDEPDVETIPAGDLLDLST